MNNEGSSQAPKRHPVDFKHPDFLDEKKLDKVYKFHNLKKINIYK